jgi:hypothetical protein
MSELHAEWTLDALVAELEKIAATAPRGWAA